MEYTVYGFVLGLGIKYTEWKNILIFMILYSFCLLLKFGFCVD